MEKMEKIIHNGYFFTLKYLLLNMNKINYGIDIGSINLVISKGTFNNLNNNYYVEILRNATDDICLPYIIIILIVLYLDFLIINICFVKQLKIMY